MLHRVSARLFRKAREILRAFSLRMSLLKGRPLAYRIRQRKRLSGSTPPHSREVALSEGIAWLYRSMGAGPEAGSRCYRMSTGWSACYPEVTGYNLYTLFDHFHETGRQESFDRAVRMADWLLAVQLESGAYIGGYVDQPPRPVVFNTAQVLQGLVRAHRETGQAKYLTGARRAADWLVAVQDPDGAWRRYCYLGAYRVTDARIAYPLAETWKATGEESYRRAATRSLNHVVSRQHPNGWFPDCDNSLGLVDQPNTHTISYTVEGLLESGFLLEEERWVAAGQRCADAMLRRFEIGGTLHGRYDQHWMGTVPWSCLTGSAQAAKNWLALYRHTGHAPYLTAAVKMNDYLSLCQDVETVHPGMRGAVAGSQPFGGGYQPAAFPSWATKYFCDSLIAERRAMAASRPEESSMVAKRGAEVPS